MKLIRKSVVLLCSLFIVVLLSVQGNATDHGAVLYEATSDSVTLTIYEDGLARYTGSGSILYGMFPWEYTVSAIEVCDGITELDEYAFYNTEIESVDIAGSVSKIGKNAFFNCKNLKRVTLHEGLKIIGDSAFRDCIELQALVLPESLETIESYAIYGCFSLKSLDLKNVTYLGSGNLYYIGQNAKGLEEITFSRNIDTIPREICFGWSNLKHAVIPDGVTTIEDGAFRGSSLSSIQIGKDVKTLGPNAFYECVNLKSVQLPEGLERIGTAAFMDSGLESIVIPDSVTDIGYDPDNTMLGAFDCPNLKEVKLSKSLKVIPWGCFGTSPIETIEIPDGVTTIEGYAFSMCERLTSITIPASVKQIGEMAFVNTFSLTSVIFEGNAPVNADSMCMPSAFFCASFNGVMFYPKNNPTWSDINKILLDSGGLMAAIPYTRDAQGNVIPEVPSTAQITDAIYQFRNRIYRAGSNYPDNYSYIINGNMLTGYGREAFAFELSDACFGYLPISEKRPVNYDALKLGDILYIGNDVWVITQINPSGIKAAGVDGNRKVCYDVPLTKEAVSKSSAYRTRYGVSPYPGEVDPALNQPKITGPDHVLTEAEVYQTLIALKANYPEGMPYSEKNHYHQNFLVYVEEHTTISPDGHGCSAFSGILSDTAFGELPARYFPIGSVNYDNIMVGDILLGPGHEMIVLEIHPNHVVIAEGNYDDGTGGRVHWGRTISRNEIVSGYEHVTRYPEGTQPSGPRPSEPEQPTTPETPNVSSENRVAGDNRYDTGFAVADQLKNTMGVEKFNTVIVAYGSNFADALAGSYLAAQKNAPILLVNKNTIQDVKDYVAKNLASGGTVYLLGGEAAIPAEMETALSGLNVKRLAGANRYATNLLILAEAGTSGQEILICTGKGFADSLSASAVNKPILLVNKKLDNDQKEFLKNSSGKFIIIGGESAVSAELEAELKAYGSVERIGGANRYETSVAVAKRFFNAPKSAVLAYAKKFPDGLCGGPLAYAMKAPLILTATKVESAAADYTKANGIKSGYVLGGAGLISDEAVAKIFG